MLIAVFALCGLAIGAVEVALLARSSRSAGTELTGPLLGLWGVGSLLAGVAVARAGAAATRRGGSPFLLAAWGAAHAALALATGPVSLGLLLFVAGLRSLPRSSTPTACWTRSRRPGR